MALTETQEAKIAEIIEAFENGKRLADLPEVSGTNPYNLIVEVLDEDGESKKAALASLLPYLEDECSYGVEYDTSVSSPTCKRIGNINLHKSLPIQSKMKGCLLDDDGNVVEYLNPKDWTGNVVDGTRGQVMVEVVSHYFKFETEGTICRAKISEMPLPGYHKIPKIYLSAYQATVDRTLTELPKLASVKNMSSYFRGGNNNSAWDAESRTLLGKPATSLSRTSFRKYARNRKDGSTEWNAWTYSAQKILYWLFVIEYATRNVQAAYNAQLTSEGYRQGGLGAGVTNLNGDLWNAFNSYNPFIPCGHTDILGNGTGVVEYEMPIEYTAASTVFTVNVPRYRGIENPFGHIWHWTDGINIRISPEVENGGDGLSQVYVCSDPALFSDSGYEGYSHVGNAARKNGYVQEIIGGEYGDIIAALVGGSSTTNHCDYWYTDIPESAESLLGVLFGGSAYNGAVAGLAFANSYNAPSAAAADFGSRLCFIPNK